MFCPFCNEQETKVIDSRLVADGSQIRRRRQCSECGERFTTYESAELVWPKVVKRDGTRQAFDDDKLRAGFFRALEKRPVSVDQVEAAIHQIGHQLRASGEREVSSNLVGELVMDQLKSLDAVAYVRFASVYRHFEDVSEFAQEVEKLQSVPRSHPARRSIDVERSS